MKLSKAEKILAFDVMGRSGITEAIRDLALQIDKASYKESMRLAGQIKILVSIAEVDDYWREQVGKGEFAECHIVRYKVCKTEVD